MSIKIFPLPFLFQFKFLLDNQLILYIKRCEPLLSTVPNCSILKELRLLYNCFLDGYISYLLKLLGHPYLLNLKTIMLRHLQKYLLRFVPYIFSLNPFPTFRRPYQVVFCVVNGVRSPSDSHEVSYTTFFLSSTDAPFIPVHRTGFSGAILINGALHKFYLHGQFC